MRSKRTKLPVVLVHVRLTTVGVPVADLEPLRDAILALVPGYAEVWGVRVKRRLITRQQIADLFEHYTEHAKEPTT